LPHYYGQYSLQSGVTYENGVIIVPAPGGGSYTVPPGTIIVNVPPGATSVTYQGCQSTISLPIPSGSTQSAIQLLVNQVMQQAAAQLAVCNAPTNPHSGGAFPPVTFGNEALSVSCPDKPNMDLIGSLPPGVTITLTQLSIAGGIFQSDTSVSEANAAATSFLMAIMSSQVLCGWWNTEQSFTCPDSSIQTVPANTYFNINSQADADATALAAAEAACLPSGSLIILKDDEVTTELNIFCENIKVVNGQLFYCPYSPSVTNPELYASPDGFNWASVKTIPGSGGLYDIAYGAGLYVFVTSYDGSGSLSTYTSPDAVTWTYHNLGIALHRALNSIEFGAGIFVAGTNTGQMITSPDGLVWTNRGVTGPADEVYRIRFLNGFFFALYPFSNWVNSSLDGISWTVTRTPLAYNEPRDIAYGNGIYVIAGNGFIYTSPDLLSWFTHAFAHQNNGLTFASGLFTVVTQDKLVLTSPDGVTWTDSGRVANNALSSVTTFGIKTIAADG
jgi:hypothetical protein